MIDLTNVKTGDEILPAGEYQATITNAESKETKIGSNVYWRVEFTINDGEFEGKKVFTNFNVVHTNEVAQRIALQNLAKLVRASNGPLKIEEPEQLLGLSMTIITMVKNDESYGENAEIKSYKQPNKKIRKDEIPF